MRIISYQYFYGDLEIAQKSSTAVQANINWFIDKFEPEFCRKLMGQILYDQYKTGTENTDGTPKDEANIDQKWKDLRDGKQYVNRIGNTVYFYGIGKKTTDVFKQSPIANYVFYHILRKNATTTTAVGEAQINPENGEKQSSIDKQAYTWNQMVDMNRELCEFLMSNPNDYPSFQDWVWRLDRDLLTSISTVL